VANDARARYRPPPAHAQAHPAQAQAQAQLRPPPPPPELRLGGGGGLVALVTPPVKFDKLPTTDAEKFWTPFAIEAAKSAPGKCGKAPPGMAPPTGSAGPLGMEVWMGGL
jgi:hypothetical protein